MTDALLAGIAGVVIGLVFVMLLLREMVSGQVGSQVQEWKTRELYAVRRDALDRSRPEVARRVGSAIAGWTHSFPFLQEDARFIGHPIDYLVFEGYRELRAKHEQQITCVTFVRAREEARDDPDGRLVEECVRLGRVEWLTLEVGRQPAALPGGVR